LIALKLLEAARWADWLSRRDGHRQPAADHPDVMSVGTRTYPDEAALLDALRERAGKVTAWTRCRWASSRNPRTANTILLAALSTLLDTDPAVWEKAILNRVPAKYAEVNKTAFRLGQEAAK
jgi:Pyruvate/2-oxoacid:ferredoxin oxidoreductase gamma subunit